MTKVSAKYFTLNPLIVVPSGTNEQSLVNAVSAAIGEVITSAEAEKSETRKYSVKIGKKDTSVKENVRRAVKTATTNPLRLAALSLAVDDLEEAGIVGLVNPSDALLAWMGKFNS